MLRTVDIFDQTVDVELSVTVTFFSFIGFFLLLTGHSDDGKAVFLRDIWPSREEIEVSFGQLC